MISQTWKNDNEENCERGWFLMSNCLSAFPPSRTLYKYLLKYVSDHGYDGYKAICQQKLLKAGNNTFSQLNRIQRSVKKCAKEVFTWYLFIEN